MFSFLSFFFLGGGGGGGGKNIKFRVGHRVGHGPGHGLAQVLYTPRKMDAFFILDKKLMIRAVNFPVKCYLSFYIFVIHDSQCSLCMHVYAILDLNVTCERRIELDMIC